MLEYFERTEGSGQFFTPLAFAPSVGKFLYLFHVLPTKTCSTFVKFMRKRLVFLCLFSMILGLKRVAAKFVPKLLNLDQKIRRMTIAQEMLNDVNEDPDLLKRVITGDEPWVYGYDRSRSSIGWT